MVQGNEIIERIQNESRSLKSKLKMKAKIIKQQEQVDASMEKRCLAS